ncbi:MAG: hypothetical protein NDJ94_07365 [Vicinamibacteria bacterium]|jgi:hypothetical protein|nr:hypothetical protein [Vicinamibacteria bacterium]
MLADPLDALAWLRLFLGAALVLSSLEWLALVREWSAASYWGESGGRGPWVLVAALRAAAGVGVACGSWPDLVLPAAVLAAVSSLLLMLRARWGLEGADQLQFVLGVALALAAAAPTDAVVRAFLGFAATLSVAAYTTAGVMKAWMASWRDGSLLAALLRTRPYGHPLIARMVIPGRTAPAFGWMVILFESAFPLALVSGETGALAFCLAALGFHFATAFAMGLNVFPWAFAAPLPAVVFWAGEIRRLVQ